jgi:hypothetical protein
VAADTAIDIVDSELERYAGKRVFTGFSRGARGRSRATFNVVWHHDRRYDVIVDVRRATIRFPVVLPDIAPRSPLDRELRRFVRSRTSADLPEHRRIEPRRAEVKVFNRGGNLALTLTVKDDDFRYGLTKLIHLVHEIFMDFLYDGRWRYYMERHFDLPPDAW